MITKQALGNLLFGMADILRDKVEDYKSYILSLLFFKRLSDNYQWEIEDGKKQFEVEYAREPSPRELDVITSKKHDFTIPQGCFWNDVRLASIDKKNEKLDKAVTEIAEQNVDKNGKYILKGIINTVRWNEPAPDGSGGKKLDPEVLTNLINYLSAVDLSNKNVTVDVLGDAYEYLIKRFADENKGGTMAGQFYTPQEVVDIIVRYLKPQKGETIYDPTCGSGGFLLNAAKYARASYDTQKGVRLFGQELVWNTWAICNINMILHGLDARIEQGDTIRDPKFKDEDNELELRTFDKVMANFPFSLENWAQNGEPKKDKKGNTVNKKDGTPQIEYKKEFTDPYNRLVYGVPPYSNGDFAFLQHIIASLDDKGKAGVVCPQGVLFRGQPEKTEEEDGQNRKADVEYLIRRGFLQGVDFRQHINIIDAIVVLPGNLFYGTTIPGAIIFFDKNKPEEHKNKVLMVYAAKKGWYREDANMSVLEPQDVLRISTMLESWGDIDKAKDWIALQKNRLYNQIDEDLDFQMSEIDNDTAEELAQARRRLAKAEKTVNDKLTTNKKPTASEKKAVETAQKALDKLTADRTAREKAAHEKAEKQCQAIAEVKSELMQMLGDPELRKRYFSIVDMDEIEENEFNLNIPRYVDTFEPEEQIDLKEAIADFQKAMQAESDTEKELEKLLKSINNVQLTMELEKHNTEIEQTPDSMSGLFQDACTIIEQAQKSAYRAVNETLIKRNWLLGMRIQKEVLNDKRAEYGEQVVKALAAFLTNRYGEGFTKTNLYNYVSFYQYWPDFFHAVSGISLENDTEKIFHAVSGKSDEEPVSNIMNALRSQSTIRLSWTHYRIILQEQNAEARAWYENEAANEMWSTRTLQRNISSQYYHRMLQSQNKTAVHDEMVKLTQPLQDRLEYLKNPVVAEFLGFKNNAEYTESRLEQSIIDHLVPFLMELGKGFAFVDRQKHIHTEKEDYYIDLVFYNYHLRCFVLIDLKTKKLNYQDVGQMDMYVKMYDELVRPEGHNPTIGLLLCADTDEDVAHYSVLNGSDQLYAAKYLTYMPTQDELRREIEQQKEFFRLQNGE